MKIKFTTANDGTAYVRTLDLCGQGLPEGNAEGLMPIVFEYNQSSTGMFDPVTFAKVTPKVTVKSSTTVNKRGGTSSVVKVSMPYTAFRMDSESSGTAIPAVDQARSGGELSAHIVLALPPALVNDLNGQDAVSSLGIQQIDVVCFLLQTLAQELLPGKFESGQLTDSSYRWKEPVRTSAGTRQISALQPSEGQVSEEFPAGQLGFRILSQDGTLADAHEWDGLIRRISRKMPPLSCGDIDAKAIRVKE